MKIFKEIQHSFSIKPVELDETLYLSMGVSLYFDLLTPGKLHSEQQLWTDITDIMGRDFEFDMGFPKKTGEFLVTGSCFAPQGETREASKVWGAYRPCGKRTLGFWRSQLEKRLPDQGLPLHGDAHFLAQCLWRRGLCFQSAWQRVPGSRGRRGQTVPPGSQRGKSRTVDRLAGKQTAPFELRPR